MGLKASCQFYDDLGLGYASQRTSDPRIHAQLRDCLGDVNSVLNVGAGTGSYEFSDIHTTALEPSRAMIKQRKSASHVVQAAAEVMPFLNQSFDAVTAFLTVHHWQNIKKGLSECVRVARKRVVLFTWDPNFSGFWLTQDYFPELLELDQKIFPCIDEVSNALGQLTVHSIEIPKDCVDGFTAAYWARPSAYLENNIRSGMSSFSKIKNLSNRIQKLNRDLQSGQWYEKNKEILEKQSVDLGYRALVADIDC